MLFTIINFCVYCFAGDMGFDDRTIMQDAQMDDSLYKTPNASNILLDETVTKDTSGEGKAMDIDFDANQSSSIVFGVWLLCLSVIILTALSVTRRNRWWWSKTSRHQQRRNLKDELENCTGEIPFAWILNRNRKIVLHEN